MTEAFQYEQIQQLSRLLFNHETVAALTSHDGLPIHIQYQNLAEIGTLPMVAQTTHQYLNLLDGDIAITNDPYSGGTILSNMYLCMGISSEQKRSRSTDLLVVKKVSFKPKISLADSIDQEGLRIPPTPLVSNGKINKDILAAMSQHPLAPANFSKLISKGVEDLKSLHSQFLKMNEIFEIEWSRSFIRKYFKDSQLKMTELLSQIRNGEQHSSLALNDGSGLKLIIDVSDEKITFDFSGSDSSKSIHLTHSAALGGCAGALVSIIDKNLPINQGVFQCIDVIAPEGSLVHAKFPKPVYFGMTDGVSIIANLVLKAIGNLDKAKRYPLSGSSTCSFNIEFKDGYFFETLEPGSAASPDQPGQDGLNIWRRSYLEPSVEEVEKRFPLRVESFSYRPNSGGEGKHTGGSGVSKKIIVLEDCKFTWAINEQSEKPTGTMGGRDAQNAEVQLQRNGEKRQVLEKLGSIDLKPQDVIIIHSAGGGGYGDNTEDFE